MPRRPLKLTFEECGDINAYFTPAERQITLCYEFFQFFDQLARSE
ncbi:MAG: hypothetical protein HOC23_21570 [Halieaceae bacterium]|nr:hypothetical protein [Halieaceae bacterium]